MVVIHLISFAVFGLIVGAIARLLVPGRQPIGMIATMILGVIGSFAGGLISWMFTGMPENEYQPAGWIMSVLGSIIVIWAVTASRRRHAV